MYKDIFFPLPDISLVVFFFRMYGNRIQLYIKKDSHLKVYTETMIGILLKKAPMYFTQKKSTFMDQFQANS